ncbi:hypothetical protein CPB86DRAFT_604759 [Serendipita vermifera]|nr:hypothetical protein CPB86DRAFT_604759 [Serendipita vermifera]
MSCRSAGASCPLRVTVEDIIQRIGRRSSKYEMNSDCSTLNSTSSCKNCTVFLVMAHQRCCRGQYGALVYITGVILAINGQGR